MHTHLWGGVVGRATARLALRGARHGNEAKVNEFDLLLLIKEHVLWLEVPVCKALAVCVCNGGNNLPEQFAREVFIPDATLGNNVIKQLARRQVLHHKVHS